MNRKNELIAKHNKLKAERDTILAVSASERTEEQAARLAALMGTRNAEGKYEGGEMAVVQAELAELQAAEEADKALAAMTPAQPGNGNEPNPTADSPDVQTVQFHKKPGFKSFGEQLQAVAQAEINPRSVDERLLDIQAAATGMGDSLPQDGGFLVQSDFTTQLLQGMQQGSLLLGRCLRIPISAASNRLIAPFIDESSRADGSRWGGVQVYWNDEGTAPTATKPKIGQVDLTLGRMTGLAYATDELLQDAAALEAIIRMAFSSEMGFEVDDMLINGDGAGKPLGILNANCLVSVTKETGQAATTIVAENIDKMWARMYAKARPNSVWLINQDCEPQLDALAHVVGTGGVPLYRPAGGIADEPFARLKGRPVLPMEQCPTLGTVGDIVLTDFSRYLVIEKGGMEAATSMHVRFTQGEQTFRFRYRVNGQPTWAQALTPKNGTNTLSPFVALATRA